MEFKLMLSSETASESSLQDLTRELCKDLNDKTDVAAKIPEGTPIPGQKGDPITIGTLLLTFLSGGAAVAMFDVLKAYIQRNTSLVFKIVGPGGEAVEVRGENLNKKQFEQIMSKDFSKQK